VIQVTDKAASRILDSVREAGNAGDGLRVRVIGGGCSGLQYKLAVDGEKKGDKVIEHLGARLYFVRKSYLYLNGTTVDYADGLTDVGFPLDNPNLKKSCGCGESFSV